MRRGRRRGNTEGFEQLFEGGARRAHRDAELFFEDLYGPARSHPESSSASEEDEVHREAVVGQPITIDLATVLSGTPIAKAEWTIEGKAVGGYDIDVGRARVTPVDTKNAKLTLFWLAGGVARLRCKLALRTLPSPNPPVEVTVRYVYDVRAPKLEHLTAKTSAPIIHDVIVDPVTKRKQKQLSFGDRVGVKGIQWDLRMTLPPGVAGQVADVQLVKLGRTREIQYAGDPSIQKQVFKTSAGDRYVLDIGDEASDCAGPAPWYQIRALRAAAAAFEHGEAYDVPATDLSAMIKAIEIDERFQYYVLFKPDLKGAIWVPIAKAEWFWRAAADQRGRWLLRSTPKPDGGVVGGKGGPTTELPQYDANTCIQGWMPA